MLVGLLKFLFWFFLISYLIKIIARIFAPILMRSFINKVQRKYQHQFNQQYQKSETSKTEEGKITIEKNKSKSEIKSNNIGDYVDFEEIED